MRAACFAGIPTRDSSVNVLSTAAVLLMQAEANMTRTEAATIVAEKAGVPLGRVHGLDWLQVVALGEDGDVVGKEILDGVLDRHHMAREVPTHPLETRGDRRRRRCRKTRCTHRQD